MPKVSFDGITKLIIVNTGITSIDVKTDLYSEWKNWLLLSDNSKYLPAFRVIGGDEIGGGITVDGTYFLTNGWKLRPYEGNHALTINGNLYVDGGGSPLVQTIGSYNVLVNLVTSNIVNLVTVSTGSAVTSQDKIDIATGVKNALGTDFLAIPNAVQTELAGDFTTILNSINSIETAISEDDINTITQSIYNNLSPTLNIIRGMVQHNFRFMNQQYDSLGRLVSGNIRIYDDADDCDQNINPLAEYIVTSLYDDNNLVDYKVTLL